MTTPHVDGSALSPALAAKRRPFHAQYLAMYSSWLGGIVTDPLLMMVPADDHMVHRGDAVFEAFLCVAGTFYNLGAHLDRMDKSTAAIGLQSPVSRDPMIRLLRGDRGRPAGGRRRAGSRLRPARQTAAGRYAA